jgi:hypothetical protein
MKADDYERDRKMFYDAHELAISLRAHATYESTTVTVDRRDFEQALVLMSLLAGWGLGKLPSRDSLED